MLEPNTEARKISSALENRSAECGIVCEAGTDPSKCCVTAKGMDTAAVEEKFTAVIQTQPWVVSLTSIMCER